MLQNIIDFFKKLFGVKPRTTNDEQAANIVFAERYADISELNLTAWVSQRVASLVVADSDISIIGENARAELLSEALESCTKRLKQIIARALGVGGIILKPYILNGKLYTDILPQDRFVNVKQMGEIITEAGFIADEIKLDDKIHTRMEYHRLENGMYTIIQKAIRGGGEVPLSTVPEWANIKPEVTIGGVEQMLFGRIVCPVDNRNQFTDVYGVPITFGQDKLTREIVDLLNYLQKEFKNKEAFIGASNLLFDADDKLPADGIYKKFKSGPEDFFEVFSPSIRVEEYIAGIDYRLSLLEKNIGLNKGVLTDLGTADATATAIKRSTHDTWSFVDDVRTQIESGIDALVYAFNVYANAAKLAPQGEYELAYDWDYSLLEDSEERFNQLNTGAASGYIHPWEVRAWTMGEDAETAQENMPDMMELVNS